MKKTLILVLFAINIHLAKSQVVDIQPEKPGWDDDLVLSYNTKDTNAISTGNEDIYARISLNFQNGDSKTISLKLKKVNNIYSNVFKIPRYASALSIVFHTLTTQDTKHAKSVKIYQNNKPVKNAFIDELPYFDPKSDSLFRLELHNYPKNYLAYGIYFSKIIPPPYSDELNKVLKKYMPVLNKIYAKKRNKENVDILFSLCIGYSKQKNIERAKEFLIELIKTHPKSPLTNKAFGIYNYESYKAGNRPRIDNEIVSELTNVLKVYPEALVCSENIHLFKNDSSLNLGLFEKSLIFAINRDSLDYSKKIQLAEINFEYKMYNKAEKMILQSIDFLLKSGIQYSWTASNSYPQYQLAKAYNLLSKIQKEKGNYVLALASINSAISLITDNQFESHYLSNFQKLKASIYLSLNNLNFAEEEYTVLYMQEDTIAKLKLLDIYKTKNSDTTGFVGYLEKLEKKFGHKVKFKKAPSFNITDRDGRQYSLNKMKGKVIVLNFWGIGCGPCVVEIPELNKLVAKYKGNENVVFLAITNDGDESLNKFFKKRQFDYKIVNTAKGLSKNFKVQGIPRHFVINQNGEIIKQLLGAKADIVETMGKSIDKALIE